MRQARRHGQRIAGKRARLVDRAERREKSMISARPADGADRQAAADDLAEAGEIGPHAEQLLRAAASRARKPVITSSKISSAPLRRAKFAQRFEIAGLRQNEARVGGNRLDDDGGDLARVLREGGAHGVRHR